MNQKAPIDYQELIQKTQTAASVEEIHHACSTACKTFEFDQFMYGSRIPTSFVRPQLIIISGYQQDWWNHYNENNYLKIDPIVDYCANNTLPLQWHQLNAQQHKNRLVRQLMNESVDYGLSSGISLPVHTPTGEFAMLSFASDREPKQTENHMRETSPHLMLLAYHIHEAVMRVFKNKRDDLETINLTDREKECLLWAAEGKTSDETSVILHIAESTVRFHLNNAAKKLNVHTRRHAIARAVCLGLITPVI